MTKKISYNPFKMWGAWISGFLGLIVVFFSFKIFSFFDDIAVKIYNCIPTSYSCINIQIIITIFIVFIAGFLLGWKIHSAIRRLKS